MRSLGITIFVVAIGNDTNQVRYLLELIFLQWAAQCCVVIDITINLGLWDIIPDLFCMLQQRYGRYGMNYVMIVDLLLFSRVD